MGVAMFYHLTHSGVAETLGTILPRAALRGWRVMLRGTDVATLEALDLSLWGQGAEFQPHGMEGGAQDADQPLLLGRGPIGNGAVGLALIDSAETTPEEAARLERVWVLFDANNPHQMAQARALWKRLTDAGQAAQYWSEESGAWVLKSEKAAREN